MLIQQNVVHLVGHKQKFASLFSVEEFWGALRHSENVRAVMPKLRQANISADDAPDMFASGATICASGLESTFGKFSFLVSQVKEQLGFSGPIEIKAYYSPDGAGFDPHYDPRTVTTLQISGSKRWSYGIGPSEQFPLCNSPYPLTPELSTSLEQIGTATTVLNQGDLLCLPPGTIHWAAATGESLAINFSFEHVGESIADKFCRSLLLELLENPELRKVPLENDGDNMLASQFSDGLINELALHLPSAISGVIARLKADWSLS
ncbi:JmjC domain-containing protein [Rhizobium leguminosarum]|uniref:JmjC domain-containing protein n=1 Tax=Rhizobium leguminosarum TaxID=384 RepID=UPI0013D9852A|nr:cupin domain-containing protein [Rhizobium leguminosarum]NEI02409.1 hypothetical protein [Rhizobium leguminosarum]